MFVEVTAFTVLYILNLHNRRIVGIGEEQVATVFPRHRRVGCPDVVDIGAAQVVTEVEVGVEFAEERHCQVELKVTYALIYL